LTAEKHAPKNGSIMTKPKPKKNGDAPKAPSVPHLIESIGGPTVFGKICGFRDNPGARGSDMKARRFIPIKYWPAILAYVRKEKPPRFAYFTYKSLAEANLGRELPN
jgi:hypothetical protein